MKQVSFNDQVRKRKTIRRLYASTIFSTKQLSRAFGVPHMRLKRWVRHIG